MIHSSTFISAIITNSINKPNTYKYTISIITSHLRQTYSRLPPKSNTYVKVTHINSNLKIKSNFENTTHNQPINPVSVKISA